MQRPYIRRFILECAFFIKYKYALVFKHNQLLQKKHWQVKKDSLPVCNNIFSSKVQASTIFAFHADTTLPLLGSTSRVSLVPVEIDRVQNRGAFL